MKYTILESNHGARLRRGRHVEEKGMGMTAVGLLGHVCGHAEVDVGGARLGFAMGCAMAGDDRGVVLR